MNEQDSGESEVKLELSLETDSSRAEERRTRINDGY
jgi:hypothetical protein